MAMQEHLHKLSDGLNQHCMNLLGKGANVTLIDKKTKGSKVRFEPWDIVVWAHPPLHIPTLCLACLAVVFLRSLLS